MDTWWDDNEDDEDHRSDIESKPLLIIASTKSSGRDIGRYNRIVTRDTGHTDRISSLRKNLAFLTFLSACIFFFMAASEERYRRTDVIPEVVSLSDAPDEDKEPLFVEQVHNDAFHSKDLEKITKFEDKMSREVADDDFLKGPSYNLGSIEDVGNVYPNTYSNVRIKSGFQTNKEIVGHDDTQIDDINVIFFKAREFEQDDAVLNYMN